MVRSSKFPKKENWAYTLADKCGVWCAECLEYIYPEEENRSLKYQEHHVLKDTPGQNLFSPFVDFKTWIVPTHQKCHRWSKKISGFDDFSSGLWYDLWHIINHGTLLELLKSAKKSHNAGNYSISLLIKLAAHEKIKDTSDASLLMENIEHCFASGTAIQWTKATHLEEQLGIHDALPSRPKLLLNIAKDAAIRNDNSRVKELLDRLESCRSAWLDCEGEEMEVVFRRSYTSISANLSECPFPPLKYLPAAFDDAKYAADHAEDEYTESTARILQAAIKYKICEHNKGVIGIRNINDVSDAFQKILQTKDISFGYRAMAAFHIGLIELKDKRNWRNAYKQLIVAQYIICMLGLCGHSHGNEKILSSKLPHDCMPGHILLEESDFEKDKDQLTTLRKEAIGPLGDVILSDTIFAKVRNCLKCF